MRWPGPRRARIGLYGFGAAAHLIAQVAVHQGREVYAFTRPGDTRSAGPGAQPGRGLGRRLGARRRREALDAALLFAPVGALVPAALQAVRPGGTVVCAGIHMSDIPSFPYRWLWGERRIVSVANLTRQDGVDFMRVAAEVPLQVERARLSAGAGQPGAGRPARRPLRRRGRADGLTGRLAAAARTPGCAGACVHSIAARAGGGSMGRILQQECRHARQATAYSAKTPARRSGAVWTRWPMP